MKASDYAARTQRPAKVFTLGPSCWSDQWFLRPKVPVRVGLRRVPAEDRLRADSEAIRRADALMPEHRRRKDDPLWQRCYEVCFVHFLISYSLCDPNDSSQPFWRAQDGQSLIVVRSMNQDNANREVDPNSRFAKLGGEIVPVASARFSEAGIARIFDEMDLLAREDKVARRMATDEEIAVIAANLLGHDMAEGAYFDRLKAANTPDANAVAAHLRMLLGGVLDIMERGREAPLPLIGHDKDPDKTEKK